MPVPITGLYAGLLAIVSLVLAGMVGALRARKKVSLGDGGDPDLIVANRRHMNFVEYVPIALILMALVELNGGSKMLVQALGVTLLAARILHPFGLDMSNPAAWQRVAGTAATYFVIVAAAITLLWQSLG